MSKTFEKSAYGDEDHPGIASALLPLGLMVGGGMLGHRLGKSIGFRAKPAVGQAVKGLDERALGILKAQEGPMRPSLKDELADIYKQRHEHMKSMRWHTWPGMFGMGTAGYFAGRGLQPPHTDRTPQNYAQYQMAKESQLRRKQAAMNEGGLSEYNPDDYMMDFYTPQKSTFDPAMAGILGAAGLGLGAGGVFAARRFFGRHLPEIHRYFGKSMIPGIESKGLLEMGRDARSQELLKNIPTKVFEEAKLPVPHHLKTQQQLAAEAAAGAVHGPAAEEAAKGVGAAEREFNRAFPPATDPTVALSEAEAKHKAVTTAQEELAGKYKPVIEQAIADFRRQSRNKMIRDMAIAGGGLGAGTAIAGGFLSPRTSY